MEKSDERFSALFEGYDLPEPSFTCKACKQQMSRMCTQEQCVEHSLHCQNKKCQIFGNHSLCSSSLLTSIANVLKQHFQINKDLIAQMFEIQEASIRELIKSRERMIQSLSLGNLDDQFKKVIEELFRKNNAEFLKGKQANKFFKKVVSLSKCKNNFEPYLAKFTQASKKIVDDLMDLKNSILKEYTTLAKISNEISLQEIDSDILKPNEAKFQENLNFIYESLDKPKGLQLLFRASEHQFEAAKFHEKCDNIEQTFTIIRTEFGKTIAGYNHLRWDTAFSGYLIDHDKKCFLLSLDLKQKMILTSHKNAVYNRQNYGPTFGGGCDLHLANKCNQNSNSYVNFPFSYNCNNQYVNNQASWTAFSGATNGYNFRVAEYEVYRVVR